MIYDLINTFLKKTDPEIAHSIAIKALKSNILPLNLLVSKPKLNLATKLFNKEFKSPIGLAAGFDKNAEVYNKFLKLGFGFVEVGTVTPKPQNGNAKPRVFRLSEDKAIINRLGFPNDGFDKLKSRILNDKPQGILGINVGPNKSNAQKIEDYLYLIRELKDLADYITINISSPNTEGLRDFHDLDKLGDLLSEINNINSNNSKIPILIKLSPDFENKNIEKMCELLLKESVNGIILTNTSVLNREKLINKNRQESGGLSGFPIFKISNDKIKIFYKFIGKKIPIIGVGGVFDGETAYEKIKCGASLLQLYTSLVYQGPLIASSINEELSNLLDRDGFKNLSEVVGINNN